MSLHLQPIAAESRTGSREVHASAHDCVRLVFIRDGSIILSGDSSRRTVIVGEAVQVAPQVLMGYEPEGKATLTLLAIDTDYLIEHLYWQHLGLFPDRDAARDLAAKLYPDPVQVLRIGVRQLKKLGPILDELVTLTEGELSPSSYFRAHALRAGCSHSVHFLVGQPCSRSFTWFHRCADQRVVGPVVRLGILADALIPRGNKPLDSWSPVPAVFLCSTP